MRGGIHAGNKGLQAKASGIAEEMTELYPHGLRWGLGAAGEIKTVKPLYDISTDEDGKPQSKRMPIQNPHGHVLEGW